MISSGEILDWISLSPCSFGWTPSLSMEVVKPVLQSAMTIGDSVLFWLSAQAGMAALRETIALLLNERGMTKSTYSRSGIIVRGGLYMKSPRQNRTEQWARLR